MSDGEMCSSEHVDFPERNPEATQRRTDSQASRDRKKNDGGAPVQTASSHESIAEVIEGCRVARRETALHRLW